MEGIIPSAGFCSLNIRLQLECVGFGICHTCPSEGALSSNRISKLQELFSVFSVVKIVRFLALLCSWRQFNHFNGSFPKGADNIMGIFGP